MCVGHYNSILSVDSLQSVTTNFLNMLDGNMLDGNMLKIVAALVQLWAFLSHLVQSVIAVTGCKLVYNMLVLLMVFSIGDACFSIISPNNR